MIRCGRPESPSFSGFRFPPDVVLKAVRWYLRDGLSHRDVEELLAERGVDVDHITIYRWVQRFTPTAGSSMTTYFRVAGVWRYV